MEVSETEPVDQDVLVIDCAEDEECDDLGGVHYQPLLARGPLSGQN